MSKKICLGCGLGCGTALLLFLIGFFTLVFIWNRVALVPVERNAVGYIIEHVDEFKSEINAMGYEVRVAYTLEDVWEESFEKGGLNKKEKLGYNDRGVLLLSNDKEEYRFDVGFERCDIWIDNGVEVIMGKMSENDVLGTQRLRYWYPVFVRLSGSAVDQNSIFWSANYYNTDFTQFAERFGAEGIRDKQIKEHISAEELRAIYERCIGLQEKLVELYKAKKG